MLPSYTFSSLSPYTYVILFQIHKLDGNHRMRFPLDTLLSQNTSRSFTISLIK